MKHLQNSPWIPIIMLTITGTLMLFSSGCSTSRYCSEKTDPACSCIADYDPVCGCNNKTYSNACMAECAGIKTYTKGECPKKDTKMLQNAFSVQWGMGQISRQDMVFSPFVHKSISPMNIGLEYARDGRSIQQRIKVHHAAFSAAQTTAYPYIEDGKTQQTSPHTFNLIDLDYNIGKVFRNAKNRISTSAGILLSSDIHALYYSYGRVGSFGYFANFGLGLYLEKYHHFDERSQISGRLSLPVVNWLARSPYLVNDDAFIENTSSHKGLKTFFAFIGDGHLAGFSGFQSAEAQLKYTFALNKKWSLGANYQFDFTHARKPRNLLQYRHLLHFSTTFKF
jgi:hypothetical protein